MHWSNSVLFEVSWAGVILDWNWLSTDTGPSMTVFVTRSTPSPSESIMEGGRGLVGVVYNGFSYILNQYNLNAVFLKVCGIGNWKWFLFFLLPCNFSWFILLWFLFLVFLFFFQIQNMVHERTEESAGVSGNYGVIWYVMPWPAW